MFKAVLVLLFYQRNLSPLTSALKARLLVLAGGNLFRGVYSLGLAELQGRLLPEEDARLKVLRVWQLQFLLVFQLGCDGVDVQNAVHQLKDLLGKSSEGQLFGALQVEPVLHLDLMLDFVVALDRETSTRVRVV